MSSYPRARQLHTPFDSGWLRLCWHGRRARHPVPGQRSNAWYHITPSGHHNQMEWRWWIRVYNLFSGNFLDFFIIGKCPSTNKSLLFYFFSFPFWEFYSFSFYIPTTMDLGQHFSDRLWRSIFLFLFWPHSFRNKRAQDSTAKVNSLQSSSQTFGWESQLYNINILELVFLLWEDKLCSPNSESRMDFGGPSP